MRKVLLNQPFIKELLEGNKLVIIDGGARGDLFSPFNIVDEKILKVIRFEADAGAQIVSNEKEIVVPKALWNVSKTIQLNVAVEPSSSSVYPFNKQLQQHIDPLKSVRRTEREVELEAISIDEFCIQQGGLTIDFIKLDIHGAEFEVLEGAINALKSTLGLLVESWILPIHKGQKTRASVELLAFEHQFYVFEENMRSMWGRKPKNYVKRQPVALDTLFFKDPLLDDTIKSEVEAIKLIGMAELFGHYGFVEQLVKKFDDEKVLSKDLSNKISSFVKSNCQPTLIDKIKFKFRKLATSRFSDSYIE